MRAIVEGTAYGAYDPGLFKRGYASRPELTLALDAPAELHELARAPGDDRAPPRRGTRPRQPSAERPDAGRARRSTRRAHAAAHLTVESYGRDWIEAQGMGAFAAVAAGSAERAAADRDALRPARARAPT